MAPPTTPLHQPHDHLFRLVFADPEETVAFLRARLPDSYQRGILWSSLRRAAGSFVDQDLHGSVSDLLFEVRSAAAAPRQWLYLLFEHQSRPDRWMALRLLRYCCRIWETDRRKHPKARFLRPVLPLVFFQGGWPVIHSATGIDEPTYRSLKRDAANGTEQTAPR